MAILVKYTPSLMEQIKDRHRKATYPHKPFIVKVVSPHAEPYFVMEVDPTTQKSTNRPQQFVRISDEGPELNIVERSQATDEPDVVEVSYSHPYVGTDA